ncbi:MAG: membrane bound O-acyl transferase family-domain-containing protein [Planctomycetota bacterium]|nr:membrane bound O-acyl transferase family-domain-containing protein [Planctomycetota bacterium]
MWLLAFAIFCASKIATWGIERKLEAGAPGAVDLAYLLLWPGMDPRPFWKHGNGAASRAALGAWVEAALKVALGFVLICSAAGQLAGAYPLAAGWAGMVGLMLILHFGTFDLLAHAWRAAGVPVEPLMNQPLLASSLSEFWNERWNRGFRDTARSVVFRPLARRWNPAAALACVFLASGLIHELVVTVPAGSGYGGPTAYFLLQGLGLHLERRAFGRAPVALRALARRGFALLVLLAPLPLLFPPAFPREVILPFLAWSGLL